MMYFWHHQATVSGAPVAFAKHVNGTWRNCIANARAWRVNYGVNAGEFRAKMYDCHAGGHSFLGDAGLGAVGCRMERCKAIGTWDLYGGGSGGGSFGGCSNFGVNIDAASVFVECEAGNKSFALGKSNAGTFIRCRGGENCFGATVDAVNIGEFSGYAEDCVAGKGSFGGRAAAAATGKCTGTLVRCISRGSELPLRLEGATIEGCLLTTGTINQDGVTLLNSGSRVHDSTILVVEGGTGVPISGNGLTVSAAGNRHNNRSASATGLGPNVTNTGAGEPSAILAMTDVATSTRATPADVKTQVLPGSLTVAFPTFTLTGASTQPFDLAEGAAVDVALVIQDASKEAVDLTDAHLRFRVFVRGYDEEVFNLDSETGGITITDAEAGQALLQFSAENLATPGRYRYECWDVVGPTLYAKGDFVVRTTVGPGS